MEIKSGRGCEETEGITPLKRAWQKERNHRVNYSKAWHNATHKIATQQMCFMHSCIIHSFVQLWIFGPGNESPGSMWNESFAAQHVAQGGTNRCGGFFQDSAFSKRELTVISNELRNLPTSTGWGPQTDTNFPGQGSFWCFSEQHLHGPAASLLRWERKWTIIWVIQATMNSLTLTCLQLAGIGAKARSFPPIIPFSPLSEQNHFLSTLLLSLQRSPREQFLPQSLLPLKSVNWCNYLDCSRKKASEILLPEWSR